MSQESHPNGISPRYPEYSALILESRRESLRHVTKDKQNKQEIYRLPEVDNGNCVVPPTVALFALLNQTREK